MSLNWNLRQTICLVILFAFLFNLLGPIIPAAQAQVILLPKSGQMVSVSPSVNPPILKGLKVHPDNPFRFDFIMDVGVINNRPYNEEAIRLIKYFLASLTIPEDDLWVNLSPYEKNRIVPEFFGKTEMGRDLLAQDYMLKQITASLIYPEGETGRKFWKRIYAEAVKKFGTTNIPVNTFNKVWILPEKAVVYENAKAGTAYVVEARLKVMLEEDYLSLTKHNRRGGYQPPESSNRFDVSGRMISAPTKTNQLGSQIIRQIVIPELNKEVNEGQNFAQLRQVYNSLVLATWYKKKITNSILAMVYEDKNKIKGTEYTHNVILSHEGTKDLKEPYDSSAVPQNDIELIYRRYLQAFKQGSYNYIKEEQDPITHQNIPKKYFSGGVNYTRLSDMAMKIVEHIDVHRSAGHNLAMITCNMDPAMAAEKDQTIERFLSDQLMKLQEINLAFGPQDFVGVGSKFDRLTPEVLGKVLEIIHPERHYVRILGVVSVLVNTLQIDDDPYIILAAFFYNLIKGPRASRNQVERSIRETMKQVGLDDQEMDKVFSYVHAMAQETNVTQGYHVMSLKIADRIYDLLGLRFSMDHDFVKRHIEETIKEFFIAPRGPQDKPFINYLPQDSNGDFVANRFRGQVLKAIFENIQVFNLQTVQEARKFVKPVVGGDAYLGYPSLKTPQDLIQYAMQLFNNPYHGSYNTLAVGLADDDYDNDHLISKKIEWMINLGQKPRVLVIGAGGGRVIFDLKEKYPEAEIEFINKQPIRDDPVKFQQARYSGQKKLSLKRVRAFLDWFNQNEIVHNVEEGLPFKDQEFDLVFLTHETLTYVKDKDKLLPDIKRVLKKDGLGLINPYHRIQFVDAQGKSLSSREDIISYLNQGAKKLQYSFAGSRTLVIKNVFPQIPFPPLKLIKHVPFVRSRDVIGLPTQYISEYQVFPSGDLARIFLDAAREFEAILENARNEIERKYDDKDIQAWSKGILDPVLKQVGRDLVKLRAKTESLIQAQNIEGVDDRIWVEFLLLELYKFDPMTAKHTIGVANIMALIARQKNLPEEEVKRYWYSGIVHDIGKLFIPRKILFNPDGNAMTQKDFDFIHRHAMLGNVILNAFGLQNLRHALYHHHRQLISGLVTTSEDELMARTAFFADILETIYGGRIILPENGSIARVYSQPRSLEEALNIIRSKFPFLIGYGFEDLDFSDLDKITLKAGGEHLGNIGVFIDEFIQSQLLRNNHLGYGFPLIRAHFDEKDKAQLSPNDNLVKLASSLENKGGIDLRSNNVFNIQKNGQGIKFHLDPGMLQQLQNASGFVPVIINIQLLADLGQFLGLKNQ